MPEFQNSLNPKYTTVCGKTVFHSRSVAVCGLIQAADGSILLTKRSMTMDTHPGKWCLPCGYLDRDESIHQALIREMYEETKLDISGMYVELYHINDNPVKDELQNITFHFYIQSKESAEELSKLIDISDVDEVAEYAWLTKDDIANGNFNGKEAAFWHFARIQRFVTKTITDDVDAVHHSCIIEPSVQTQFEF